MTDPSSFWFEIHSLSTIDHLKRPFNTFWHHNFTDVMGNEKFKMYRNSPFVGWMINLTVIEEATRRRRTSENEHSTQIFSVRGQNHSRKPKHQHFGHRKWFQSKEKLFSFDAEISIKTRFECLKRFWCFKLKSSASNLRCKFFNRLVIRI